MSHVPREYLDPHYRDLEQLSGFPQFPEAEAMDHFIDTFLQPRMNKFISRFVAGAILQDYAESPEGEPGRLYTIAVTTDQVGNHCYSYEIIDIENMDLEGGSAEWFGVMGQINDHPLARQIVASEGGDGPLIDEEVDPDVYCPELFMAREYRFKSGEGATMTMAGGYGISGEWFSIYEANGGYDIRPGEQDGELMATSEAQMTHGGLSSRDMGDVLEVMEAFDLCKNRRDKQGNIIVPDFSRQNRI